jgi:uncharacterized repeat protein (TIGR01451 family)
VLLGVKRALAAVVLTGLSQLSFAWQLEVDEVTLNWNFYNTVTFQQPFPVGVTPVVLSLTPGTQGAANDEPAAVHIQNVTNVGFQIAIVEPAGSNGRYETNGAVVSYLAIEPGVHTFPNGDVIEAGTITTSALQHGNGVGGAESWATQNLNGSFSSNPVLVGLQQSLNNESLLSGAPGNNQQSEVWVTMTTRNVAATSFQTAIERSEVNNQPLLFNLSAETMGYVVMDNGSAGVFQDNNGDDVAYESFRTGDNVRGWGNGCYHRPNAGFFNTYSAVPKVFASKITHGGGDGGWARQCALSATQVGLAVDEDVDRDSERNHTTEDFGVLVFGQPFVADIEPQPEPLLRKTVLVDRDPINDAVNPKAIPGAEVLYTIRVENLGDGVATNVQLDDPVPDNMDVYVANTENCGSVAFRDGAPSSGLSCAAANVSYDDGSGNFTYSPTADVDGFDALVTDVRINFTGSLSASGLLGDPSFEVDLRMRVR